MKVILLQDVKKVGKKNETVEVSDGYFANFLAPKKLAVKVSETSIKILNNQKENARIAEENAVKEAKLLAEKLNTIELEFKVKAKEGKMFGAISSKQICDALEKQYSIIVDKRKILDKSNVDSLGYHRINVELHKGVNGIIKVHVVEE